MQLRDRVESSPQPRRLDRIDTGQTYAQLMDSSLFRTFRFKERQRGARGELQRHVLSPSPFEDAVTLTVDTNATGRIVAASLLVGKPWFANHLRTGLDLAKCFVNAFAPLTELAPYQSVSDALWNLRTPHFLNSLVDHASDESDPSQCARAFVGLLRSAQVKTELARLSIENVAREDERLTQIVFELH